MLDWLKTILGTSYTDDIDAKVSAEIGKGFVSKSDYNAKTAELKTAKEAQTSYEKQLEELKKATGTAEELTAKINALQEQNTKDKAAYDAQVAQIRLDAAVDKALSEYGARNNTAAKALLQTFLKDAKVGDDGTVRGLTAEIDTLAKAEATSFMFDSAQGTVIKGMKPGEAGDNAGHGGETNPFAEKTYDVEAQGKLFRKNPEAARAMAKQAGIKFL